MVPTIAKEFHRSVADVAFTITATLMMRPLGALLFGWMADRWGRRLPLMIDVIFYSVVEVLSGFAPSYTVFLVLRALYGIGMGGEWGVGASLAMEVVPARWRGTLSGLLQEGYSVGYLLAAGAYFFIFPHFGWRPMFIVGGLPALLTLYIRTKVPESLAWERARPDTREILRAVRANLSLFIYLVVLMTMMNLMGHATQDMYPTFLQRERGLDPRAVATIAVIYSIRITFGRRHRGLALGPYRTAARDGGGNLVARPRGAAVGFSAFARMADGRRVRDAIHGAGRVGSHPRSSFGTVTAAGARAVHRTGLPVGRDVRG